MGRGHMGGSLRVCELAHLFQKRVQTFVASKAEERDALKREGKNGKKRNQRVAVNGGRK